MARIIPYIVLSSFSPEETVVKLDLIEFPNIQSQKGEGATMNDVCKGWVSTKEVVDWGMGWAKVSFPG